MSLQSICIFIIIEMKVYNILRLNVILLQLNNHSNCHKENNKHTMSNFVNSSYKSIIFLIMVNLPPIIPDE